MQKTKKELRDEYKQASTPAGIYQIRNLESGKILLGSALNLPGIINSNRFQLRSGSHMNRALQADWNALGAEAFAFEILDELKAGEGAGDDLRGELGVLMDMWLDKLKPYGERGYNQPK